MSPIEDAIRSERPELLRLVRRRMDPRLRARFDPADVVQDACLEAWRRTSAAGGCAPMPPTVWLRLLAKERVIQLHRRHLGARMRDARRETGGDAGERRRTSDAPPDRRAADEEVRHRVRSGLRLLGPRDRRILELRYVDGLENTRAARVLGLTVPAASKRHVRALRRLGRILAPLRSAAAI